jgi:hypothetical protein
MMSPEHDSHAVGRDLKRIHEFLNSDQYHIDDAELTPHLEVCPSCRAHLVAQAGEPERWRQASLLLQTHEYDQASSADYSAPTFCSEQANQPVVIKDVLDNLVPSEHPNHLGRLGRIGARYSIRVSDLRRSGNRCHDGQTLHAHVRAFHL